MTTIINHDLRVINGATITMPPYIGEQTGWGNLSVPNPFTSAPVTVAEYPIGTALRMDERAFRYVQFGAHTGTSNYWTTQVGMPLETGMLMSCTSAVTASASIATTPVAGDTSIEAVMGVDCALDEYAGGYCYCHGIGNQWGCKITGNDAVLTGSTVTFDLEAPYPTGTNSALSGTNFSVNHSPWKAVVAHSGGYNLDFSSIIGVNIIYSYSSPTMSDKFGWIQTWGPCHVQANSFGGGSTSERTAYGRNVAVNFSPAAYSNMQIIGFLMQESAATGGTGTDVSRPYVWLQICP